MFLNSKFVGQRRPGSERTIPPYQHTLQMVNGAPLQAHLSQDKPTLHSIVRAVEKRPLPQRPPPNTTTTLNDARKCSTTEFLNRTINRAQDSEHNVVVELSNLSKGEISQVSAEILDLRGALGRTM